MTQAEPLTVDQLTLDTDNPRAYEEFASPQDALAELVVSADVGELVDSIALSGWMDIEPLIVVRSDNRVLEGNRRLAALLLIRDPALAKLHGVTVPPDLHPNAKPQEVRCILVDDAAEARDYIGFKHINGPFKWDAFAKAKYAARWLDDDGDVNRVAKRLGDAHNTVVRLVNGYRVYLQAASWGFERLNVPGRFAFSHLYTALTRPNYRKFLGLPDGTGLLGSNPVPTEKRDALIQVMEWLFGQDDRPSVIRSQNPDLKRLGEVLASENARGILMETKNLDSAHVIVEDRAAVFADALYKLQAAAVRLSAVQGGFEGNEEHLALMDTIVRQVRAIHAGMKDVVEDASAAARGNAGGSE